MKNSKFLQLIIVIMLVLSFTDSPAVAQYEPQMGSVDEDGDLVVEALPSVEGDVLIPGGEQADPQAFPDGTVSPDEVIGVDTVPYSPVSGFSVMDTTPTFTFTRDVGANKYQIEVKDVYKAEVVYTFKGAALCNDLHCSLTPTTKLKPEVFNVYQGYYSWRVRSKTTSGWGDWSAPAYFYVMSNGFNSTFDLNANKWQAIRGDWFRVDPGYLKTKGVVYEYSSVIRKERFYKDYVYEVVLKRKVKDSGGIDPSNRIYFMALPGSVIDGSWEDGYEFFYYDDGGWYVNIRKDGSATFLGGGNTASINPNGWNKLTVFTDLPFIDFWINETYLGYIYVDDDPVSYNSGYVGVAGYRNPERTTLLVDSARLYYTSILPYPFAMSVDGARDPAYELKVDPAMPGPRE